MLSLADKHDQLYGLALVQPSGEGMGLPYEQISMIHGDRRQSEAAAFGSLRVIWSDLGAPDGGA